MSDSWLHSLEYIQQKPAPSTQRCSTTWAKKSLRGRFLSGIDCLLSLLARKLNHTCCQCLYHRWYSISTAAVAKNFPFSVWNSWQTPWNSQVFYFFSAAPNCYFGRGERGSSPLVGCNRYCTCSFGLFEKVATTLAPWQRAALLSNPWEWLNVAVWRCSAAWYCAVTNCDPIALQRFFSK